MPVSINRRQARDAGVEAASNRPIVLSANASWNIVNFREGLIRGLHSAGYDVIAMAPPDEHSPRLTELGCRFVPIEIDNKGANPVRDLALFRRYLHLLRAERPMAYLGYTIKPNVYGSLAAQRLGIPVVNNISGLGTAFIRSNWLTTVAKMLYRTGLRRSRRVFFQNEDDRRLFVAMGLVAPERTGVLAGSGIDLTRFAPAAATERPPHERRFLLIARLLWDKGVGEYVEAARRLRARHPNVRFQILGFLDVENRTAVSRDDIEAWVRDGVIDYLGATDDVRPFIADADCVVLPSYREGTARTLLEAAAMGRPLLASDVPGCRNVVDEGLNGFLSRVRDGQHLAERMEAFLALSAAEVAAMGRHSRAKVEAEFDERHVVERYAEVLSAIRREQGETTDVAA